MMNGTPTGISAFLRRQYTRLRRLGWLEIVPLLLVLVFVSAGYALIELTDEVQEGKTQRFDERVLRALRRPDSPELPIGPLWMREVARDATALGNPFVILLIVTAVTGFMLLNGNYTQMLLTLVATGGGAVLAFFLKQIISRDRPSVVSHLDEVTTTSFPSGHAMLSAVVYLTLGILLMATVVGRREKTYCLLWAMFLPFIVGISRIYLGVHYPTDVLAGWMAGSIWALACWGVSQYLQTATVPGSVRRT